MFSRFYTFYFKYSLNQVLKSEQRVNKIPQMLFDYANHQNTRTFSTSCRSYFFNNCENRLSNGLICFHKTILQTFVVNIIFRILRCVKIAFDLI